MLNQFEPYLNYDNRDTLPPLLESIFISNPNLLLTWDDILWLHQNELALRDVDARAGKRELDEGQAYGDGHALAGFALNPNLNPWINSDNKRDARKMLESNQVDENKELTAKLVENFNISLLMTIKQSFDCHNPFGEMLLLVKNRYAKEPYDLNRYYYFGKCGKGTNGEIIACVKPKLHYEQQTPYGKYPTEFETCSKDIGSMFLAVCRMIKSRPEKLLIFEDDHILKSKQIDHEKTIAAMAQARDWTHLKSLLYLYQCEWLGYSPHTIKGLQGDINDDLVRKIEELMVAHGNEGSDIVLSKLPDTQVCEQIIKPALKNILKTEQTNVKDSKVAIRLK